MGREIVREECLDDPGKRSRLWDSCDTYIVLKYSKGTQAIQSITLNIKLCAPEDITSLPKKLSYFHWDEFPLKSLPSSFGVERIVEIIMPNSGFKRFGKNLVSLRKVDLDGSSSLMELPDLSKASNLREVSISGCKSLRQVPPSAVCSQKLKYLKVSNWQTNLKDWERKRNGVVFVSRDLYVLLRNAPCHLASFTASSAPTLSVQLFPSSANG
ncbi:Protein SUPPRESSOR OF npr1-1, CONSTITUTIVE [Arachis hypogaea]|nr:Protein SUPPRESSOR OF npr1-1, CONSTITUTIVE [Arachis hypogaea]